MSDWDDADDENIVSGLVRRDNGAGAVFTPFLLATPVLVLPEIGIRYDEAGKRRRQRQRRLLAEVNLVEMFVTVGHLSGS